MFSTLQDRLTEASYQEEEANISVDPAMAFIEDTNAYESTGSILKELCDNYTHGQDVELDEHLEQILNTREELKEEPEYDEEDDCCPSCGEHYDDCECYEDEDEDEDEEPSENLEGEDELFF